MGLTPTRKIAIGATLAATLAALAGVSIATASSSSAATGCGVLFDDFNYSSRTDAALSQRGWSIRSQAGGPGVSGASWLADNVSFPTVDGQKVAQLKAVTNGTAGGTSHAEFSQSNRRFFEGTYLARIKFSDAPASGTDGDHINQTFYTISPLAAPMDPNYSEMDFSEYLPNGGWGEAGPINYQTTWYTYVADPWYADNQHSQQAKSINGWHDVMATVSGGHVKYYIDGALVGDHSGKVYPRQNMSIDFNQWFIDLAGHSSGTSTYLESIDYLYHAKKQVLTPAQATTVINNYRSSGTTHTDSVVSANDCDPGTPPNQPTTPPNQPTTPPPASGATMLQSNFSGRCIDIPNGVPTAGSVLQQWDCNGTDAQKWAFQSDGTLRAMGKCMDPAGGALANGTPIQLADCNGNAVQRFTLTAARTLQNVSSGRCVDIKDWNGSNGAKLQLWDCAGTSNQIWGKL
ncbi:glycoside hydrolase family 16 protein [Actinoplanes sp. TFC3]|uniref:glycoside hydrolase family 16 protein n=1 Tax=Actinoplanes sp. TFC3 TaxID=1710355 RepID=UPI000829F048|nr:glycoside hydrolase family 16 protein [Actinoplanes sp. TFC3]